MKKMNKQTRMFAMIATTIACFLLMISGCTEQNNTTSPETLQTILEKAAVLESVYYEIDTSFIQDGTLQQTTTIKIWQKMPYMKEIMNSTSGNMTITQTIIKRPEGLYRYDATLQTYELDPQIIIPQPSTVQMVHDLLNNQTLTIIGTENISGKPTTVIQYSPNHIGNSTIIKMWIWNEKGVPLQEQYTMNNEETSVTIDATYSNYSFAEIPESIFSTE
jgi:outer membrane lipoprotein-sorting protein